MTTELSDETDGMIPALRVLYQQGVAWVLACPNKGVAHKDAVIYNTNTKYPHNQCTTIRDCRYIAPTEKYSPGQGQHNTEEQIGRNGPDEKAYDLEDPLGRNGVLCLFLEANQMCLLIIWGTIHDYFNGEETASVRPWCKIVTPYIYLDRIVLERASLAGLQSWSFASLDSCFASLKGNGVLSRPWEFQIQSNVNQGLQKVDRVHYAPGIDTSGNGSSVTVEIKEVEFMGSMMYEISIDVN